MSKIIIIGAGAMGTAFAVPCYDNGHEVHVIGTHLEDKLIEKIRIDYIHPSLKTKLPKDINFNYYKDLNTIINSKVDLSIFKGSWPKGKQKIFDTPHAEADYIKTVIRHEAGVYDKQIQSRRLARSASQTMKWED